MSDAVTPPMGDDQKDDGSKPVAKPEPTLAELTARGSTPELVDTALHTASSSTLIASDMSTL